MPGEEKAYRACAGSCSGAESTERGEGRSRERDAQEHVVQRWEEGGASSVSLLTGSLRDRAPAVRRGMPCWEGVFSVLVKSTHPATCADRHPEILEASDIYDIVLSGVDSRYSTTPLYSSRGIDSGDE